MEIKEKKTGSETIQKKQVKRETVERLHIPYDREEGKNNSKSNGSTGGSHFTGPCFFVVLFLTRVIVQNTTKR